MLIHWFTQLIVYIKYIFTQLLASSLIYTKYIYIYIYSIILYNYMMLIHLNIILGTASSNKNPKQNCCHSNFNFEGLLKPNREPISISNIWLPKPITTFLSWIQICLYSRTILLRVGLVEVRACFWGCMIKSSAIYREFLFCWSLEEQNELTFEGRGNGFCKAQKT